MVLGGKVVKMEVVFDRALTPFINKCWGLVLGCGIGLGKVGMGLGSVCWVCLFGFSNNNNIRSVWFRNLHKGQFCNY